MERAALPVRARVRDDGNQQGRYVAQKLESVVGYELSDANNAADA